MPEFHFWNLEEVIVIWAELLGYCGFTLPICATPQSFQYSPHTESKVRQCKRVNSGSSRSC